MTEDVFVSRKPEDPNEPPQSAGNSNAQQPNPAEQGPSYQPTPHRSSYDWMKHNKESGDTSLRQEAAKLPTDAPPPDTATPNQPTEHDRHSSDSHYEPQPASTQEMNSAADAPPVADVPAAPMSPHTPSGDEHSASPASADFAAEPNKPEPTPLAAPPSAPGAKVIQQVVSNGVGYQAQRMCIYRGEFVIQWPVKEADLAACAGDRFIPPRNTADWEKARFLLKKRGVVILCAPMGTGRRTAALRLLTEVMANPKSIVDLEPEWEKPDVKHLPVEANRGFILDLSDMHEQQPGPRFGQDLLNYGLDGAKSARYLTILTTPDEWRGVWAEETRPVTIKHSSPPARDLVRLELRLLDAEHRIAWLDDARYEDIWRSNPPAQEARRLARIVYAAKENDGSIIDEFRGWKNHIDALLTPGKTTLPGEPELISTRATVWAGALLHGGRKRSVLHAADLLLNKLDFTREPLNVLADATSSHRLKAASLTTDGDRVFHERDKHDLAPAILRHLWEEFPTQRKLLRSWAVAVVYENEIPEDDARIAATTLLELSRELHDNNIIDEIAKKAKKVSEPRMSLVVDTLTEAALDRTLGKYVRQRMYQWMLGKPSEGMVDLVTRICGGELAAQQPSIAITRLARAAEHSDCPSPSMVKAFRSLAENSPTEVAKALETWLTEEPAKKHGLVAFLSLAASDVGTGLLLRTTESPEGRKRFVRAWQQLIQNEDYRSAADHQLDEWGLQAENSELPTDHLADLMAEVYEPKIHRSGLGRFFVKDPDLLDSFWGDVYRRVIIRTQEREKV